MKVMIKELLAQNRGGGWAGTVLLWVASPFGAIIKKIKKLPPGRGGIGRGNPKYGNRGRAGWGHSPHQGPRRGG